MNLKKNVNSDSRYTAHDWHHIKLYIDYPDWCTTFSPWRAVIRPAKSKRKTEKYDIWCYMPCKLFVYCLTCFWNCSKWSIS